MDFDKKTKRTIIFLAFVCIIFFLALKNIGVVSEALSRLIGLFMPFIIGASIAFMLNVPMARVENFLFSEGFISKFDKKPRLKALVNAAKRPVSFFVTFIIVIGVMAIAMNIVVPQLSKTMEAIAKQIPDAISRAEEWISSQGATFNAISKLGDKFNIKSSEIAANLSGTLQKWGKGLVSSGFSTVSGIISGFVSFLIGLIFAIYILLQKEKLASQGKQLLYGIFSESAADRVIYILSLTNNTFAKFLTGQCLEACILGTMFFLSMSVIGIPYSLMISVMIALLSLIPLIGSSIGCVFGALLILMINPSQALIFIILFLVLQQIEGNLIYPFVVGNSIGLPSIWVLMAVVMGASLMGALGMIVFIPLCSVIYSITTFYIKESLDRKGINPKKWMETTEVTRDALMLEKHKKGKAS